MSGFKDRILTDIPEARVLENEPMSEHTSFRIGGPADFFVFLPVQDIPEAIKISAKFDLPIHIMGGGTNILVPDYGVRGAVFSPSCGEIKTDENVITAGAGCRKAAVAAAAMHAGLSGLEFFHGIPGTVGGGIIMNAGAYGGETGQVIKSVLAVDRTGNAREFLPDELEFSYRHSFFSDHRDWVVASADFILSPGTQENIKNRMDDLASRRRSKQPLEWPSAGSVFRRPAGYFAGKLIEDCGLKGISVGEAQVSEKHAGFIINRGGATCSDVKNLIELIKNKVSRDYGVELVCEIEFW